MSCTRALLRSWCAAAAALFVTSGVRAALLPLPPAFDATPPAVGGLAGADPTVARDAVEPAPATLTVDADAEVAGAVTAAEPESAGAADAAADRPAPVDPAPADAAVVESLLAAAVPVPAPLADVTVARPALGSDADLLELDARDACADLASDRRRHWADATPDFGGAPRSGAPTAAATLAVALLVRGRPRRVGT